MQHTASMGIEASLLSIYGGFLWISSIFPDKSNILTEVNYLTGPWIFPGSCVHKRCYFQTEVNLWEASYSIYCETQRDLSNYWLIVVEHFIALYTNGYVFIMQWEALYMTATTQLFSLDVSSDFWALYNENKEGSCGVFYTCCGAVNPSWHHCALKRRHSLDFALHFALIYTLL